jgi:hypothetical protein
MSGGRLTKSRQLLALLIIVLFNEWTDQQEKQLSG